MNPVDDLPDVCGDCGDPWDRCQCPFTPTFEDEARS